MSGIIKTLKKEQAFRQYYHAETGQGIGERNSLEGLAPVGLFLEILGVRLFSPQKVALHVVNPFPWPVTLKYRGLVVLRQLDKTVIIFPDGQTTTVVDPTPCVISLD